MREFDYKTKNGIAYFVHGDVSDRCFFILIGVNTEHSRGICFNLFSIEESEEFFSTPKDKEAAEKGNEKYFDKRAKQILKKQLKKHNWAIDDFIERRVYPYCYIKNFNPIKKKSIDKSIYLEIVKPILKTENEFNEIEQYWHNEGVKDFSRLSYDIPMNADLVLAIKRISKELKSGNHVFFRDLSKSYSPEERISPEKIIYSMAFPDDTSFYPTLYSGEFERFMETLYPNLPNPKNDYSKPIKLRTRNIRQVLEKFGYKLPRSSIHNICKKLNIEIDLNDRGGKTSKKA